MLYVKGPDLICQEQGETAGHTLAEHCNYEVGVGEKHIRDRIVVDIRDTSLSTQLPLNQNSHE